MKVNIGYADVQVTLSLCPFPLGKNIDDMCTEKCDRAEKEHVWINCGSELILYKYVSSVF